VPDFAVAVIFFALTGSSVLLATTFVAAFGAELTVGFATAFAAGLAGLPTASVDAEVFPGVFDPPALADPDPTLVAPLAAVPPADDFLTVAFMVTPRFQWKVRHPETC
jgi:hypothetical protein